MLKVIISVIFLGFFGTLGWQIYENPRACHKFTRCLSTLADTIVWPYYWFEELT